MKTREEILSLLKEAKPELEQTFGVRKLALFGSASRNETRPGSDVDLLVEFAPEARIGLFEFARLRRFLARLLGCEVDLATPDALHRELKDLILGEAIYAG